VKSENVTKDKILLVAAQLFGEMGYENASMRIIAERCQITKPALYYYFTDKKNLFEEIIQSCVDYSQKAALEIVKKPISPVEKLIALIANRFISIKEHPEIARFFTNILSGNFPRDFSQKMFKEIQVYYDVVKSIVKEGKEQGIFRSDFDEDSFIFSLLGGANIFIGRYCKLGIGDLTIAKAKLFVDTLVEGILIKKGQK